MHSCSINGKYFDWILISRRSCFRAGVRYYVRGRVNFAGSKLHQVMLALINVWFYGDATVSSCVLFVCMTIQWPQ